MLHALAAGASSNEVWWLHGARNRDEHPFAEEARTLIKALAHGHSHIRYSAPAPEDRPDVDFDARGRLDMRALRELAVPLHGDFYVSGPLACISELTAGSAAWCASPSRIDSELFRSGPSAT